MSASRPERCVKTLNWIGLRLEMPKLHSDAKVKALRGRLTSILTRQRTCARAPPLAAVRALEICSEKGPTWALAHCAGHFRWLLGCSGRWDDGQHTEEATLSDTSASLDARAWQTKTGGYVSSANRILPLSCPKRTFSGRP